MENTIQSRRNGAATANGKPDEGLMNHDGQARLHDRSATASDLLEQARAARNEGKHQAAVNLLARAIATDPNTADLHWQRATALLALGRLDDAADGFREAIRLKPDSAPYHNDLGVVLARRGRRRRPRRVSRGDPAQGRLPRSPQQPGQYPPPRRPAR